MRAVLIIYLFFILNYSKGQSEHFMILIDEGFFDSISSCDNKYYFSESDFIDSMLTFEQNTYLEKSNGYLSTLNILTSCNFYFQLGISQSKKNNTYSIYITKIIFEAYNNNIFSILKLYHIEMVIKNSKKKKKIKKVKINYYKS